MRQKDLPLILVAAFFAGVIAYALTNFYVAPARDRVEEVPVVEPVSAEFQPPDERYFNNNSINPTRLIEIDEEEIDFEEPDEAPGS